MFTPALKCFIAAFFGLLFSCAVTVPASASGMSLAPDKTSISAGKFTKAELTQGFKELTPSDLEYTLRLNVLDDSPSVWKLTTRAETPLFTSFVGEKPCNALSWRINSSYSYVPLTTNETIVAQGDGDKSVDLDFRILADWKDAPAIYSINIVFTLFED